MFYTQFTSMVISGWEKICCYKMSPKFKAKKDQKRKSIIISGHKHSQHQQTKTDQNRPKQTLNHDRHVMWKFIAKTKTKEKTVTKIHSKKRPEEKIWLSHKFCKKDHNQIIRKIHSKKGPKRKSWFSQKFSKKDQQRKSDLFRSVCALQTLR